MLKSRHTTHLPTHLIIIIPIELAFSKVKYLLKAIEAKMQALQDIDTILLAAFSQITAADCCAWMNSIDWHLLERHCCVQTQNIV